jgi:microcystin-dependent protein
MYFTETHWDDLIDGVLAEHTQTGTHGAITATSAAVSGAVTAASAAISGAITAGSVTVGGVSTVIPAGTINQYAGTSAPTGWLLADGTAVSRTTYATLFAVTSTTYGVGDGSTTFNLPDLKGRIPVGKNTGTFATLGSTGGAETHTLSQSEMPTHSHGINSGIGYGAGGYGAAYGRADANSPAALWGFTSGTAGSGSAHNNLQPYITVNYIIKT